jgi:cyclophilin family peptidyl-prolyl cis-trans isomerase
MRVRASAVVTLTCALGLAAAAACAQDQPAAGTAAAPAAADTTKKPAAKAPAKASPAAVDAAVKAIDAQIAKNAADKKDPAWKTKLKIPTLVKFDPAKSYYARMVTNKGEMLIKLKPEVAPFHVTNFIYLARLGFYDGTKFHRVMKGFMAQGGCPLGTGTGGPGYSFNAEISPKALHNAPGVLSTANTGQPGSDGSQFFIMFRAYASLDGGYSVFGQVEEGLETLKAMEAVANPGDGPPTVPLNLTKVTIEVK